MTIYIYIYIYIYKFIYIYTHIYIYIHTYILIYILYIYIRTYILEKTVLLLSIIIIIRHCIELCKVNHKIAETIFSDLFIRNNNTYNIDVESDFVIPQIKVVLKGCNSIRHYSPVIQYYDPVIRYYGPIIPSEM